MDNNIKYVFNNKINHSESTFDVKTADNAIKFHKTIPDYGITPLVPLDALAKKLGLSKIWVKDESKRFGLNAFKGLGASYAIAKYIADKLCIAPDELTFDLLTSESIHAQIKDLTFVTATDGNHGRAVAWTAKMLGVKAVVYMPKGSAKERVDNIRKENAVCEVTDFNYDDTVRLANKQAEKNGWKLIQDTAWEGYSDIPRYIMEGYTTLGAEISQQISEDPTHIFLQAGVGAMAGALTGYFRNIYKDVKIVIVEPNKADCMYRSALAGDGERRFADGDLNTIMAGLACGEPCTIAWEELVRNADYFMSLPDWVSANGMRISANPIGNDTIIVSGESGAVSLGTVYEIMTNSGLSLFKRDLGLNEHAKVVCISTEGATDIENYYNVIWQGAYSKY